MKLYTEEQVKMIYEKGIYDGSIGFKNDIQNITCYYQPIELPSDEDEEKAAMSITKNIQQHMGFNMGAKWMKEQIINQNNNNEI